MNILYVAGTMNRGGAETFMMNVVRNIDRSKYKIIFLCYGDKQFDYEDEINKLDSRIIRIEDVKDTGVYKHIKEIKKVIIENDIKVVHAHTYYNAVFSLIAAKLAGVEKRIAHSHSTFSELNPNLIKKIYFNISKMLINYLSNIKLACGKEAGEAYFGKKEPFAVVNNGIDLKKFQYSEKLRSKARNEYGIDKGALVLINVARFEPVKNHKFLIEVFAAVLQERPEARLILVGGGSLRGDVEKQIDDLNLGHKVIFTGIQSDVSKFLSAADVMVFPSFFEGMPVSLIEAQASGIKCVVGDNVDRNIKIMNNFVFLSVRKSRLIWADAILSPGSTSRDCNVKDFFEYNIASVTKKLEALYAS